MNRDDIIRMALKCGSTIKSDCEGNGAFGDGIDLLKFAALVAAASASEEREACVNVVSHALYGQNGCGKAIDAIRARGQE